MTWDPKFRRLYAVQETVQDPGVADLLVSDAGQMALGNLRPVSGAEPCFILVNHRPQPSLVVANYGGGSLDWYWLSSEGSLARRGQSLAHEGRGPHPVRQAAPHPHHAAWDPQGMMLWVSDLGSDAVVAYRATSAYLPLVRAFSVALRPGSGPRMLAFHPRAPYFYVAGELDSTVAVYRYALSPTPSAIAEGVWPTLPDGAARDGNTAAHVALHPALSWLYVSNRGDDSIAVFQLDGEGRIQTRLAVVKTRARTPRHFALTPDGRWLIVAGQGANCLEVMAVGADGVPRGLGSLFSLERPSCVALG